MIIGKNNSGKSKLLEALAGIVEGTQESMPFEVRLEKILTTNEAQKLFPEDTYLGAVSLGNSLWELIGRYLQNQNIIMEKTSNTSNYKYSLDSNVWMRLYSYHSTIIEHLNSPYLTEQFKGYRFLHLRAERDINKETIQYEPQITQEYVV